MDISAQLYRIKEFIVSGVASLPLILGGISILLACSTANTGYAILAVCLTLIVPLAVFILNLVSDVIVKLLSVIRPSWTASLTTPNAGICMIVPTENAIPAIYPSYWMASIIFFMTFIFMNGLALYNFSASDIADSDRVSNRKTHALIGMIGSVIIGLLLLAWRFKTGCENTLGVLIAIFGIGSLAVGLFKVFEGCGLLRVIDLYGVGSRMFASTEAAAPTQVCFPIAQNTS